MNAADLRAKLNEATSAVADAARRLVGVIDIQTVGAILHEKQSAEIVAANLSALLDNAAAREEAERIADARGRRIAKIKQELAAKAVNGKALQGVLGERYTAAVEALRAVQADITAAGFHIELATAPEFVVAHMAAAGRTLVAESKTSEEFLDDDAALAALGHAREAYSWATGATAPSAPHVVRQVINQRIEPGSMSDSEFVRDIWIASQDDKDRVLHLLGEGSTL